MRSVIVTNVVPLDGFYADENGNPVVLTMDEAFDAYNLTRLRTAGTVLLGRTSFEGFSRYGPFVANAPHDPTDRALSVDNQVVSRLGNCLPKAVVSDSLVVPTDHPRAATTTVIGCGDVGQWLAQEQRHGTADILVFTGLIMWNGLMTQGRIDELHLTISPVALAADLPLYPCPVKLSLTEVRPFPSSGNVLLRYRPQAPDYPTTAGSAPALPRAELDRDSIRSPQNAGFRLRQKYRPMGTSPFTDMEPPAGAELLTGGACNR